MIKVLFVCHGNICRSPMAEFLLKHTLKNLNKEEDFYISSAATSMEELGNPVHPGARRKLSELGIDTQGKYAVKMKKTDYGEYDYIIGMDDWNIRNILRITGGDPDFKISKLLDFTDNPGDISDPWYTGNFEETYDDIIKGVIGFLKKLQEENKVKLWD